MTTTLIYEPIAYISDDYFKPLKASRSVSKHDNADGQSLIETQRLALNIAHGNAAGWTTSLPETNDE
jgi:hypothetical protein